MSRIEQLKAEHQELKEQVDYVKKLGVVTPAGFAALLRLRELLQDHLVHEDQVVYPRLEAAALRDRELDAILERFRGEMKQIAVEAEGFFTKYTQPSHTLQFAKDVATIFALLSNRIITEEAVLYPYLAKLPQEPVGLRES